MPALVAPLLSLAAPIIADVVTASLTDYLKEVVSEYGAITQARAAGELYQRRGQHLEAHYRCLILVVGMFGDSPRSAGDWSKEALEEYGLIKEPSFYLELRLSYLNGTTHLYLQPLYLEYTESTARRDRTSAKNVSVSVVLNTSSVKDGKATNLPFAAFMLDFGKMKPGSIARKQSLGGMTSEVYRLPTASNVPAEQAADLVPFYADIIIIESSSEGAVYERLQSSVVTNKPKISPEIINKLLQILLGIEPPTTK